MGPSAQGLLATPPALEYSVYLLAAGALLIFIVWLSLRLIDRGRRASVEQELKAKRAAAESECQRIVAQAEAQAKNDLIELRKQFDKETEATRTEIRQEEKRLAKREDSIDSKLEVVNAKERRVEVGEKALAERERSLEEKDRQISEAIEQQRAELHRVANLSQDAARKELMSRVEREMQQEVSRYVEKQLEEARDTAETQAREILINAIQRYAADHTCDSTVSTVDIPSDDMKGRVIGREGRNIRAFEKATGVDVIVDDTPGVVVVSAFDPVRRETARRSLEKLIQDGRIHPTRIEEVVASMEKEVTKQIREGGKQALIDANVRGVHPKLTELLGRLQFRTSYGQNVLKHSLEVSYLGQVIAEQLGLNGQIARRSGLLHDIGKAVDHEVEGGHPEIGADLCKRYGEKPEIVNAVAGHHGDVEATSLYTPIIAAADAVSASRPGARRESLERYVQRLQKLEEIAGAFEGVKQAYAIQAGREVRVIVDSEQVDDKLSLKIARDVARRIEDEMEYPGEVRVTVVREVRSVEYAR